MVISQTIMRPTYRHNFFPMLSVDKGQWLHVLGDFIAYLLRIEYIRKHIWFTYKLQSKSETEEHNHTMLYYQEANVVI